MDWGNAFIRKKTLGPQGEVTAIDVELFLEGDFKKTKKKIHWLAEPTATHPMPSVTLLDYDYLITKQKLEEDDNVADFVTPQTEFRVEAIADANVLTLSKGDIIQFERKGYYILDRIAADKNHFDFISIPDGRAASIASKATPAPTTAPKEKKTTASTGGWGKSAVPSTKSSSSAAASSLPIATGPTETAQSKLAADGSKIMLSEGIQLGNNE